MVPFLLHAMNILKNSLLFTLLFSIATLAYVNGFDGGFLLDDTVNLINLKLFDENRSFEGFTNFLLSLHSGSFKRPIPSATFLLNATSWPAQPYWFKVTNLIIHLINGFLLYLATKALLSFNDLKRTNIHYIALISSALWILHPYFVSTVLYVIQRMAMLPVSFVLLSIILYCKGRHLYVSNRKKSIILIYSSLFIMTTLAVFSKENGLMLPAFLLLIERIIIHPSKNGKLSKFHYMLLFAIPLFVIFSALIYSVFQTTITYQYRDFSMFERLLSEFRVLTLSLNNLFIPNYFTEGVFTDSFVKSTSFFHPITTLYSFIFIILLLLVGFLLRKKNPLISFSILFFFTAHIIESTLLPLELYFEHRNYLPSLFLFLPLAKFLVYISQKSSTYKVIPLTIILFLSFTTYLRASFWGNHNNLILESLAKYPQSVRASTVSAEVMADQGYFDAAFNILEKSSKIHDNLEIMIDLVKTRCDFAKLRPQDAERLITQINNVDIRMFDIIPLNSLVSKLIKKQCQVYDSEYALRILSSVRKNNGHNLEKIKAFTAYNYAKVYAYLKDDGKALKELKTFIENSSLLYQYNIIPYASEIIELLIHNKQTKSALKALELLKPILNSSLYKRDIYSHKKRINYYYKAIENS